MVGLVLVSHSRALALAAQELVRSMTGPSLPLAIAAGAGENHAELGTDAVEISEAILSVKGPEGVLVLMDMGSAVLSSETALDLLDESQRAGIRFCAAPFVEGAVAAGVTANLGVPLDEVYREAMASLQHKLVSLASHEGKPAPASADTTSSTPAAAAAQTVRAVIHNEHGLHARPAAKLIGEARAFQADITVRNLSNGRGPVSIRSLSCLASLEILHDSEIEIAATGKEAGPALEKIARLIAEGLGDTLPSDPGTAKSARPREPYAPPAIVAGPTPISGGIAIGPAFFFQEAGPEIPENTIDDVEAEIKRLREAITSAQRALEGRRDQMRTSAGAANAEIYGAQILALQDPELVESAVASIRAEKINAAMAWDRANRRITENYRALQDDYLRERIADLEDIGRQVLEFLVGKKRTGPELSGPCILVADDLTPFQVASLPHKLLLGVILRDGGPTAHSSILLKALGIPAIIRARTVLAEVDPAWVRLIALDGTTGEIWPDPESDLLAALKRRQAVELQRAEEERQASSQPGATLDDQRIEIFANIGAAGAEAAVRAGAEGIGLLRTEFLFLDRESPPTEDEQIEALRAVAETVAGRPVIVRTLDAGGDKQLPYLPMAPEENPFLGVRAIRLCFAREDVFTTQLRAILRAGHGHDFRIMFPMIANVTDFTRARALLDEVHAVLESENIPHLWPVRAGMMVEIPSAALQAEALAERADFFSIGTNDLTQYTMAADRGNPALGEYQDALHPSILRLVRMTVDGARAYDRPVAVCGEAASDEHAAAIFTGLGVGELSMSAAKIPHVKAALRKRKMDELRELAGQALACSSAPEVRALAQTIRRGV
jgi:phosphocarrier protein FPr